MFRRDELHAHLVLACLRPGASLSGGERAIRHIDDEADRQAPAAVVGRTAPSSPLPDVVDPRLSVQGRPVDGEGHVKSYSAARARRSRQVAATKPPWTDFVSMRIAESAKVNGKFIAQPSAAKLVLSNPAPDLFNFQHWYEPIPARS
jgi:hypothetical protein